MNVLNNSQTGDRAIPVKRLQYRPSSTGSKLVEVANTRPFLKGPIYMDWLSAAASLPGKAINLALAVRWLVDMNGGKPAKLTAKALALLNVSEDACSDGLRRLESASLITVTRQPGQRPTVGIRQPAQPR
jgi:hypothetical protein